MKIKHSFYYNQIPVTSIEQFVDKEMSGLRNEENKESFDMVFEKLKQEKTLLDIFDIEGNSPTLEEQLLTTRRNLIEYVNEAGLLLENYRSFFTHRYKKPISQLKNRWDYFGSLKRIDKFQSKNRKEKQNAADKEREEYLKKAKEEGSTWD